MRFSNIPDFEDFDPGVLNRTRHTHFIIFGNFFFQDDPFAMDSHRRKFNYKSGISEQSFHALVRDFCERRNREIILESEDIAIIPGDLHDLEQLKRENGTRFSYDFVDAKRVQEYVSYTRTVGGIPQSQFREARLDG